MWRVMLLAGTAGMSAGCGSAAEEPGRLEVTWDGATSGQLVAPATARLCGESGIVLVEGIRADSGVAMALFPPTRTDLTPGEYPVYPGTTLDVPRPGGLVAFRAFDGVELHAWTGDSGSVTLEPSGDRVNGRFTVRLRRNEAADTLDLRGTLDGVVVVRDSTGCGTTLRRSF